MNNLKSITSVLAVILFVVSTLSARAQRCNPIDAIIGDFEHYPISDQVRVALALTATKEQYEAANAKVQGALGFDAPSTKSGYLEAKASAEREAQSSRFLLDRPGYLAFLTQKMTVEAADRYSQCMERDKTSPGLRLWLVRREGDFFFLRAYWIGATENQSIGETEGTPSIDGVAFVQEPRRWPRGVTQEIVVRKASNVDGFIKISVGGQANFLILLRDPDVLQMTTQIVSSDVRRITSGGTSDGHSPFCQTRSVQACVKPTREGGYLVVGTGKSIDEVRVGRAGTKVTVDRPDQICLEFWAATGACETEVSIQGRASAVERYPVAR